MLLTVVKLIVQLLVLSCSCWSYMGKKSNDFLQQPLNLEPGCFALVSLKTIYSVRVRIGIYSDWREGYSVYQLFQQSAALLN